MKQPMMVTVWCHNWEDASKLQYLMQILQVQFHDYVPRYQIFMLDDSKIYKSIQISFASAEMQKAESSISELLWHGNEGGWGDAFTSREQAPRRGKEQLWTLNPKPSRHYKIELHHLPTSPSGQDVALWPRQPRFQILVWASCHVAESGQHVIMISPI